MTLRRPLTAAALVFAQDSARRPTAAVTQALAVRAPIRRNQALGELAEPLAAVLRRVALLGATELRDELIGFSQAGGDELLTGLVQALRAATAFAPELRGAAGFEVLAGHCADRLAARLALRQREQGDWAIEPPVRHQTRRRGRPYTLVLTKTDALFESERRERACEHTDVAWLAAAMPPSRT